MSNIVQKTINLSLVVQVLALIIGIIGLGIPLSTNNMILRSVLGMETIVQIIELIFYTWFGVIFTSASSKMDIARYRYFDWFFTTPTMLLSTMMFFDYKNRREAEINQKEEKAEKISIRNIWNETKKMTSTAWNFAKKHNTETGLILGSNALMLITGYLQEVGKVSIITSTLVGFMFFGVCFYNLYAGFVRESRVNNGIFFTMLSLWGLYGIAALYKNKVKNTAYNILDMFSKNFYAVFIAWYIYSLNQE